MMCRRQTKRTTKNHTITPTVTMPTDSASNVDRAKTLRNEGTIEMRVKATSNKPAMMVGRQSPLVTSPPASHSMGGSTNITNNKPVTTKNEVNVVCASGIAEENCCAICAADRLAGANGPLMGKSKASKSAKELFAKDREGAAIGSADYMRGEGVAHRSQNPNSYPMTDTEFFPSRVRVRMNGVAIGTFELADDPADHRGILSWHSQLRDRKLREAGSYGWLLSASLTPDIIAAAAAAKELVIRLEVDESLPGGLAIYGERFGRYPLDPTLVFNLK